MLELLIYALIFLFGIIFGIALDAPGAYRMKKQAIHRGYATYDCKCEFQWKALTTDKGEGQ